jgi:hypothetical protein
MLGPPRHSLFRETARRQRCTRIGSHRPGRWPWKWSCLRGRRTV